MQLLRARSTTSAVTDWLEYTRHPRIFHLFDTACNLINERGDIISIVTPQIGMGPFNLVVEDVSFYKHIHLQSQISITRGSLMIDGFVIETINTLNWNPRPNWEVLHAQRENVLDQIAHLQITPSLVTNLYTSTFLSASLTSADLPSALAAAKQLAGLGIGLTPAGDDLLMGALYAVWILHPHDIASVLAHRVAESAAPLTTSLSAAWLRSAGRGEAGMLWHTFFDTLLGADTIQIQIAAHKILAIGATSGADALSGFMNTFLYDRTNIQHG